MASEDTPASAVFAWLEVLDELTVLRALRPRPRTPTADDVRAAFHVFCDTFHPDRHLAARRGRARRAVSAIFKRGTEAYVVLSDAGAPRASTTSSSPSGPARAPRASRSRRSRARRRSRPPARVARGLRPLALGPPVRAPRRGAGAQGRPAPGQAAARHGRPHGPGQRARSRPPSRTSKRSSARPNEPRPV